MTTEWSEVLSVNLIFDIEFYDIESFDIKSFDIESA